MVNIISILGIVLSVLLYILGWVYYCASVHQNQDLEKVVYDSLEQAKINEHNQEVDLAKSSFVTEDDFQIINDAEIEPNY